MTRRPRPWMPSAAVQHSQKVPQQRRSQGDPRRMKEGDQMRQMPWHMQSPTQLSQLLHPQTHQPPTRCLDHSFYQPCCLVRTGPRAPKTRTMTRKWGAVCQMLLMWMRRALWR